MGRCLLACLTAMVLLGDHICSGTSFSWMDQQDVWLSWNRVGESRDVGPTTSHPVFNELHTSERTQTVHQSIIPAAGTSTYEHEVLLDRCASPALSQNLDRPPVRSVFATARLADSSEVLLLPRRPWAFWPMGSAGDEFNCSRLLDASMRSPLRSGSASRFPLCCMRAVMLPLFSPPWEHLSMISVAEESYPSHASVVRSWPRLSPP